MTGSLRVKFPLYLGFIGSGMVGTSAPSALLHAARDWSLSHFQSSFILTANFLGMLAAVLVSGLLADRAGKKPFLLGAGASMAMGLLLAALAPSYPLLLAGLILAGIGFGLYSTAINAICADMTEPGKSGSSMGVLHFFYGCGAVLGPVLVKACAAFWTWQAGFALIAVLPVAVTILVAGQDYASPRPAVGDAGSGGGLAGGWAFLILASMAVVLYVATEVSSYGWLPDYWETLGTAGRAAKILSPELTATVFWVFLTLGRLTLGLLSNKMGPGPFVAASASCGLASAGLWALFPGPWTTLAFASLLAFSISSVYPSMMGWATSAFPGRTGFASSFVSVFAALAGLVAPMLFGRAADLRGIGLLPLSLTASCAAMLAFSLFSWAAAKGRRMHQPSSR